MTYDFDLFIIGAGSAGLAAAKQAAQYGVKVAIAEQQELGGCCVNRGCIPKKLMVFAADFAAAMQEAEAYGWEPCTANFHWQKFQHKRDRELQRLRQVQKDSLTQAGVHILQGHTQFVDPQTVQVNRQRYTARHVLLAVGGKPIKPDISGIEYTLTSDDFFNLQQLPKRIAIIGGGYIGVEFASVLRGFGCEVTIMNHEACILEGFDDDVRSRVRDGLIQRGIQSLCNTTTNHITQTSDGICLQLTGDCPETLVVDQVLCATGRAPNLEGLGLDAAGVEFDPKAIAVDEHSRTSQPHIYAVGDCTSRKQLTPVARTEGQNAVDAMFGSQVAPLDYHLVPSAVLSRPEVASVGLTESQARDKFDQVNSHCKEFIPLRDRLTPHAQPSFIKVVVDQASDRLLGIHMVGEHAAEIVQSVAIALHANVSYHQLMHTIGIHPSSGEELLSL
ncbi:glutathione-disulfide reductase [Leptolyngbya sp. AN02str]|uniref:glutathione-disulfide reductase n=1 Tax=Leptolyngbya sp. AN02str TaxID=3423363 RepID=UPI003D3242FA